MCKLQTIQAKGITPVKKTQWLQFSIKSGNPDAAAKMKEALPSDGTIDNIFTSYAGTDWKSMNNLDYFFWI